MQYHAVLGNTTAVCCGLENVLKSPLHSSFVNWKWKFLEMQSYTFKGMFLHHCYPVLVQETCNCNLSFLHRMRSHLKIQYKLLNCLQIYWEGATNRESTSVSL